MFEDKEFQDFVQYISHLAVTLLDRDTGKEWGVHLEFSGWQANVWFILGNFKYYLVYDGQEEGCLLKFFAQLRDIRDRWYETENIK